MPPGPHGDPNGEGLPDLEEPPATIEGATGGPASPFGGLSALDKAEIGDAADTAELVAAGGVVVAAGAGSVGAAPATAGAGLFAAVAYFIGQLLKGIADDPPRPFQHVVHFERRVCTPPGMSDPIYESLGIASQHMVAGMVTANGYLDALERLGGALKAKDYDWAITHSGVRAQCHDTLVVNLATIAAAWNAASNTIAGTPEDRTLSGGGVRAWIETPGVGADMRTHLSAGGLSGAQADEVIANWKTDPTYKGSAATLSEELTSSAKTLYGIAERLFATS